MLKRLLAVICLFLYCLPAFAQVGNSGPGGIGWAGNGLPLTNAGDMLYLNTLLEPSALPIGTVGQVLTVSPSLLPEWSTSSASGTVTSVALSLAGLPFLSISGSPITTSGTLALAAAGTKGDIIYASNTNTYSRLAVGSNGQILTLAAGIPAYTTDTYPATNTKGDIIFASAANVLGGLGIGTTGQILNVSAGGIPQWSTLATGVSSFSGDSALLSNSSSTGAVTATLANAGAASIWGNWTASSHAPSYNGGGTTGQVPTVQSNGTVIWATPASPGVGTVTSFSAGNLSTWFNTSVANPTSTPALTFSPTGAKGDIAYFSASNTPGNLTVGSTGQIITVASGAPAYTTNTYPSTDAKGDVLIATAANTVGGLAIGSTGNVLTVSGGLPVWAAPATSGTVTSFSSGNLSPLFTTSVATATSTPALTYSLTNAGAGTLFGNFASTTGAPSYNAPGTTGQILTVQGSGAIAWANPANSGTVTSFSAGNLSTWFNTSVSSATTTPALSFSPTGSKGDIAYFSASNTAGNLSVGSTGQIMTVASQLPSWTTNTYPSTDSEGDILYASAANTITGLAVGTNHQVLITNGTVPSWGQVSLTAGVTGVLPIANGGTDNGSLAVTAGGVIYTDGTKLVNVGAGTSGQVLESNGSSAPSWATASSGGGFGGNGADGAISNPSSDTAPLQKNATTWSLTGANTYTVGTANTANTGAPFIINCTSTFTLGDATNASTITCAVGSGASGGTSTTTSFMAGNLGAGPGGGGCRSGAGGGGSFGAFGGPAYDGGGGSPYISWTQGGSGGGGSYGNSSSFVGGNSGGEVIVCAVGAINSKAVSVVNTNGGAGTPAASNNFGPGGGSGGLQLFASQASVTLAGTYSSTGGNGSSSAAVGGGGGGSGGRVIAWSPSNSTGSATFTLTGGTGGTGSTANGSNGSTSTAQSIGGTPNLPLICWAITTPQGLAYLDTLTNLEIACGRKAKNNIVSLRQNDVAWGVAKDISEFCYYNMGNFEGSTCMAVGDYVEALANAS